MSSYRNSNNNSSDRSSNLQSNIHSSTASYSNTISPSRRPDGSYREEIRIRPGYVPEGERQAYVPPPARTTNYLGLSVNNNYTVSDPLQDNLVDRIDSWADLDAPVLSKLNGYDSNHTEEPVKTENSNTKDFSVESYNNSKTPSEQESIATSSTEIEASVASDSSIPREPRKPSQLATAIDTAIDSLSVVSDSDENGVAGSRQIGRFAAQIANDEREGKTYTPRRHDYNNGNNSSGHYNNRYENSNNSSTGYYYSRSENQGSNRDYRGRNTSSWNRISGSSSATNRERWDGSNIACSAPVGSSSSNIASLSGVGNSSGDIRVEKEFKSFLEQIYAFRREMAVINAKLEYIRYFKNLDDSIELSNTEKSRISMEPELITRMDAIFDAIEVLALQH